MEEALIAYLLADGALTGLVDMRIHWDERPQGDPLPAIVLHLVSAPRSYSLAQRETLAGYLVQMDCWAESKAEAKGLARALIAALDGLRAAAFQGAFIENERSSFEAGDGPLEGGATDIHGTSLDVRVWHNEA